MTAAIIPLAFITSYLLGMGDRQTGHPAYSVASGDAAGLSGIKKMKEALAQERKVLAGYERDQSTLRAEVIRRRKLFHDGTISKDQVVDAEQLFVAALTRLHAMRESVIETDIAVTEAILGEKVLRMPILPLNGYSQTAELARFNGGFKWSLREAPRIERFFSETFGHTLPITAKGQSATHNRFGFDHHDAMDVALHPDSPEGKVLINQLRKSGIPFIAFRSVIPGVSTGPHIHIGKASVRSRR